VIFNQFSFLWIAGPLVGVVVVAVWRMRRGARWLRAALVLGLGTALGVLWLALHPTGTASVTNLADAERLIGSGKPTVVEFFSEY
jgi:hypothetical protein